MAFHLLRRTDEISIVTISSIGIHTGYVNTQKRRGCFAAKLAGSQAKGRLELLQIHLAQVGNTQGTELMQKARESIDRSATL
jgi:hypothetical protein